MFLEYTNEYRELAQQCLAFARAARNVGAKAEWLQLARNWQRVAEEAEKLPSSKSSRPRENANCKGAWGT
jgi:hypothetical protein